MKILFIGDIFGKPGRQAVSRFLPEILEGGDVDLVIANAENIHHGKGVSNSKIEEMKEFGVDFFTSGNHIWKVSEILDYMDRDDYPLIRPANYPAGARGRGYMVVEKGEHRVLVINLMGRVFMHANLDDPFRAADRILEEFADEDLSAVIVDFHAEAGSEKWALANYLDGRVSAVIGTHTHVPTADERVLPGGTAMQTDAGMCGPIDSIIGLKKEEIINQFLHQMPVKHEVADGPLMFNATLIEVDSKNRRATNVERILKYTNE